MIRDRCGDSPSFLPAVDHACVIANYRLIGLRNARIRSWRESRGIIALPRSQRGICIRTRVTVVSTSPRSARIADLRIATSKVIGHRRRNRE